MTVVFVHGNPETAAIWGPLRSALAERGVTDTVCVSPPGFGSPVPQGWGATRNEYVAWLVDQLRSFDAPVDLVGHDWGAGHVFGVLADHPTLVRSWAADCAGLLHRDYVWHDAARQWQDLEIGESVVDGLVTIDDAAFVAVFGSLGMGEHVAREVRGAVDATMGRCILALYRDAAQPVMSHLGERFVAVAPPNGLVIVAENDHFAGPHAAHREIAHAVSAEVVEIAAAGHWWMIETPDVAADALVAHWQRVK